MITHERNKTLDSRPGYSITGWILIVFVMLYLALVIFQPSPGNVCGIQRTPDDLNRFAESLEHYQEEYGKLPNVPSLDFEAEGPQAVELIIVLLGKEDTSTDMQNRHEIVFLTMRTSKNKRQGGLVMTDDNKPVGIYDSWGNPLRVILRSPGQSTLTVTHAGKQVTTSKPVVVLSRGADGKWFTKDDLISETEKK